MKTATRMKAAVLRFFHRYLNEDLGFRAQLFNLLGFTGAVLGFIMALVCLISGASIINIITNLLIILFSVGMLAFANRTGQFRICYLITVLVVFFIAFPFLFFSAGGYDSGMPAYFVFAVVFTVIMVEGRARIVVTALEVLLYLLLCLTAYYYPATVTPFEGASGQAIDTIVGTIVACLAVWAVLQRHIRVYDKKQHQLQKANNLLRQANQSKTVFWGNVSHELKTPLTVISNHAQSLRTWCAAQPNAGDATASAALIAAEADRLALMVAQVLDMTRMEEGHMDWDIRPCYLDELIYRALQTHYPILNKANNQLEIHIDNAMPLVPADAVRIGQVVVNLVSNASSHTENGRITLSAWVENDYARVMVQDTGEGISTAHLPYVFERYYTSATETDTDTGTGLGLHICRQIVEAHGGTISIDSKTGQGTVVTFTLPLAAER